LPSTALDASAPRITLLCDAGLLSASDTPTGGGAGGGGAVGAVAVKVKKAIPELPFQVAVMVAD
jgi:hypothetical protein